jgi:hypothetical protein
MLSFSNILPIPRASSNWVEAQMDWVDRQILSFEAGGRSQLNSLNQPNQQGTQITSLLE